MTGHGVAPEAPTVKGAANAQLDAVNGSWPVTDRPVARCRGEHRAVLDHGAETDSAGMQ